MNKKEILNNLGPTIKLLFASCVGAYPSANGKAKLYGSRQRPVLAVLLCVVQFLLVQERY